MYDQSIAIDRHTHTHTQFQAGSKFSAGIFLTDISILNISSEINPLEFNGANDQVGMLRMLAWFPVHNSMTGLWERVSDLPGCRHVLLAEEAWDSSKDRRS